MAVHNPIVGSTIRWTLEQGTLAGKTFEHTFDRDGTIRYRMLNGNSDSVAKRSEIAQVADDVWAISYLGSAGYTLTVILNFKTHQLVSFASNEKQLGRQNGSFQIVRAAAQPQTASSPRSANRH